MAGVLDREHESAEDAALAALACAEEIFQARAKFVVVGQLIASPERAVIKPTDPEAVMASLGWYSTEGDARSAAESLWHNTGSGETFRTVVLPVHHGTPADFHKQRRDIYEKKRAEAMEKREQEIHDWIKLQGEFNAYKAELWQSDPDLALTVTFDDWRKGAPARQDAQSDRLLPVPKGKK